MTHSASRRPGACARLRLRPASGEQLVCDAQQRHREAAQSAAHHDFERPQVVRRGIDGGAREDPQHHERHHDRWHRGRDAPAATPAPQAPRGRQQAEETECRHQQHEAGEKQHVTGWVSVGP
jgi:hypothetical protein